MTIEDGGRVINDDGYVGYDTSTYGTGTVTVGGANPGTGEASTWNNNGDLYVGYVSEGVLTIERGGIVRANQVTVGSTLSSEGTIELLGGAVSGRGVLETGRINTGNGTAALILNGGILRATANGSFLNGFNTLAVGDNGAWFDTNGHDIVVSPIFSSGVASSFSKIGDGTLTLTGNSSGFGGTTHINTGTLQLGGTSGFIAGNVVNDGIFAFNRSSSFSISGTISGSGSVHQLGSGTTVLTGLNSYSGGTHLLGGALSVSSNDNLGLSFGTLTFNGGTLRNTAAFATARNITLNAGGGTFRTDADLTANGVISGIGALTKTGANGLVLSGANSYDGGTTVSAGFITAATTGALGSGPVIVAWGADLRFINDSSAESLHIAMATNAAMRFDDSASAGTATIINAQGRINFGDNTSAGAASITGDGGRTSFNGNSSAANATIGVTSNGTLDFYNTASAGSAAITSKDSFVGFHGANTADDATIINDTGGKVDISDLTSDGIAIGSLSGDGVVFLGSKSLTLGGLGTNDTIGGVIQDGGFAGGAGGSLIKTGAGTLTLNGVSTYTGLTTIGGGKLVVGDDSHSGASIAGAIVVAAGGTIGGAGTVGTTTVASGGTIAPGNSIGTLNVAGDYTQKAGSTYVAEIDPSGNSDLINVTGKATIEGGTVFAFKAPGGYSAGTRYTILTAGGGVIGSYNALGQNAPFVDLALAYDPANVYLDIARNTASFPSVGATPNQKAAAAGAESLGSDNTLYDAVVGQTSADDARAAFDALSGEVHASAKTALIEDSHFVREAASARVRAAFEGVGAVALPVLVYGPDGQELASAATESAAAWGSVFGAWGSNDGNGNAAGFDRATGGFLTGLDGLVTENMRLGILTGYSHSSFDADDRASSGSSDNYHLGLYGGTQMGALGLRAGAAYG